VDVYNRRIPRDGESIDFTVFETDDPISCGSEDKSYGQLLAESWIQAASRSHPNGGEDAAKPFVILRASPDRGIPVNRPQGGRRLQVVVDKECVFLPVLSSAISTFDNTDGRRFNNQESRRAEAHADMDKSPVPGPPTIEGEPMVDSLHPFLVGTEEFELKFDAGSPLINQLDVPKKPRNHREPYNVVAVGYCIAFKFLSTGEYTIRAEALGSDRLGRGSRYQSEVTYDIIVVK
jgi:hypothetical protein